MIEVFSVLNSLLEFGCSDFILTLIRSLGKTGSGSVLLLESSDQKLGPDPTTILGSESATLLVMTQACLALTLIIPV